MEEKIKKILNMILGKKVKLKKMGLASCNILINEFGYKIEDSLLEIRDKVNDAFVTIDVSNIADIKKDEQDNIAIFFKNDIDIVIFSLVD